MTLIPALSLWPNLAIFALIAVIIAVVGTRLEEVELSGAAGGRAGAHQVAALHQSVHQAGLTDVRAARKGDLHTELSRQAPVAGCSEHELRLYDSPLIHGSLLSIVHWGALVTLT